MVTASLGKSLTVPASMKARVFGNPDELKLVDQPVAPAFLTVADFGRLMAKEDSEVALVIQSLGLKKSAN